VEKKIKAIADDAIEVQRLIQRSAAGIAFNKKMNRFYDAVYEDLYEAQSLQGKCFLNFGPGNFRHKYWTNVDKEYDSGTWGQHRENDYITNIDMKWDVYDRRPLAIADASIEVIYSSHVIEHIWDDDALFLFKEFMRILKPGGILRLVTPDCDLAAQAWIRDDWAYLAEYYWKINTKSNFNEYFEIARSRNAFYLLDQFSLLTTSENSLYLKPQECESFLLSYESVYDALDAASLKSDKELNKKLGKHVNWFNERKLADILDKSGFESVEFSQYGKSKSAVLRDIRHFDKTDPTMSLYMEAVR